MMSGCIKKNHVSAAFIKKKNNNNNLFPGMAIKP